ncbi:uncharacterized protein LOC105215755 isoform X2 [Zeugodacus cucurbitae]|uniref:uncharacterized protein LOC105215755 isoform X2 n=1 Tax=Zeugodacus cucurbitae TaxID=28588 RepID=UPI0010A74B1A|nr:uncharacterized protein LOC105215755 isoform X2 [Zeugodacus cucurbitae]
MYVNNYLLWVVLHEILFLLYPTAAVERKIRQSNINSTELSHELSHSNEEDEVNVSPRWTNINAEVDVVIPMILDHLQKIKIEHLNLPDITETISLFEYNFLLQVMPIDGYGKVIGNLEDTIMHAEIAVDVTNISLDLQDFRILDFRNINVQLDQIQIIRELSGLILSPITNLFKQRITTSISDGLKQEMELIFNDFNEGDPLQLRTFAKQLLAGLIS